MNVVRCHLYALRQSIRAFRGQYRSSVAFHRAITPRRFA